ncbi:hypothetical protein [Kribbella soli]|uniref:Uncharacterized protein n=1 Tax=Kribbella soli TaxID=1124743 RepID=A0A4R0GU58_9ACTN|nr:hypothetical protein [Kribbella soli]TCC01327.1 hypothetical protein E0H45_42160 [Kribbella soli]
MTDRPTQETLDAIADLLVLGEQHGIGVTFTPDGQGWQVGYMRGMGGGDLSSAYDLDTAVRAALRPLVDLAARLEENRAQREGPTS